MDETRKPSSLAKLRNLAPEKKVKLTAWLEEGLSYHRAVPLIQKEFGLSTSVGALHAFWESEVAPLRLARRSRAAQLSSMLGTDQQKAPVNWDPILDDSLKEMAFELMQLPQADPEKVFFLMQLVMKGRDFQHKLADRELKRDALKLTERRVKLLEGKMEKASAKLKELRDPSKADNAATRQLVLDEVDVLMGIKKAP